MGGCWLPMRWDGIWSRHSYAHIYTASGTTVWQTICREITLHYVRICQIHNNNMLVSANFCSVTCMNLLWNQYTARFLALYVTCEMRTGHFYDSFLSLTVRLRNDLANSVFLPSYNMDIFKTHVHSFQSFPSSKRPSPLHSILKNNINTDRNDFPRDLLRGV